ncbi:MAG: hypothetical protein R3263_04860, partial [Myxococcota bacterium]|nr:hypothetical protein [Myxococcota bacterium]
LSERANREEGERRWTPVDDATLAELARRSAARTAEDPFFVEVRETLAERAADDGVVRLAELIAEREEARTASATRVGGGSPGEDTASVASTPDDDEDERSPQVEEALRVLADLVLLTS